ncbi:MAG: segregation/condensation protein A [Anaerolineales bacterium]|nr:segregation/condensation protein A [Anaerolineales bacterium]
MQSDRSAQVAQEYNARVVSLLHRDAPQPYTVDTPVYQGPLDLLLQLIERAELDITKLALAQVTDQFLGYMRTLQELKAERVSEFLVVAARLMQIKSEALLPRPVVRQPDEEDPGEALVQQLLLYKRFKELASLLTLRQDTALRSYLRMAPPPKVEGRLDLSGMTAEDVFRAAMKVHTRADARAPLRTVVAAPRVTIREKIKAIADVLRHKTMTTFRELVSGTPDRLHVVVTFLAMLELVRRYRIAAKQEELFQEIELRRDDNWNETLDFELEFTE